MHERKKLKEATFFLHLLTQAADTGEFEYLLSAFLSAARSVLQYALKEAEALPGGRAWYNAQVSGAPLLGFFKSNRDINIHSRPVEVMQEVTLVEQVTIRISESLNITATDSDGAVEVIHDSASDVPSASQQSRSTMTVRFFFSNVPGAGNDDVIAVCQSYLTNLDAIVNDGAAKGFVSG